MYRRILDPYSCAHLNSPPHTTCAVPDLFSLLSAMPTPGTFYCVTQWGPTASDLQLGTIHAYLLARFSSAQCPLGGRTLGARVFCTACCGIKGVWWAVGMHRTRSGFVTQQNAKGHSATCTISRGAQHKSAALLYVHCLTCTNDTMIHSPPFPPSHTDPHPSTAPSLFPCPL